MLTLAPGPLTLSSPSVWLLLCCDAVLKEVGQADACSALIPLCPPPSSKLKQMASLVFQHQRCHRVALF